VDQEAVRNRDPRESVERVADHLFEASPAEGKDHETINSDLGNPDDGPTKVVFEFLEGVLKRAEKSPGDQAEPRRVPASMLTARVASSTP
jgi:hypothetical protein